MHLPGAIVATNGSGGEVDARALFVPYVEVDLLTVRQTRRLALELLAAADAAEAR